MVSWPEAVTRVNQASPSDLELHHRRLFRRASPIVIAGHSGSGKTEIWSRLTENSALHEMSSGTDDGYMIRRNEKAHPITTIPGQPCKSRDYAMNLAFSEFTRLEGVVFVASNGYDHIWGSGDVVASNLNRFDLRALRKRNMMYERWHFGEVCQAILKKRTIVPPEYMPKWLLVVANKADLYWDRLDDALSYYQMGRSSEFGATASELVSQMGTLALQYQILPLATKSAPYEFHSFRGSFQVASQLTSDQCDAALRCLIDTLGEFP